MFTTFVLGGLTRRVLKCLQMEAASAEESEPLPSEAPGWAAEGGSDGGADGGADGAALDFEAPAGPGNGHMSRARQQSNRPEKLTLTRHSSTGLGSSHLTRLFTRVDEQVLRPLFGGPNAGGAADADEGTTDRAPSASGRRHEDPAPGAMEMMDVKGVEAPQRT